eukprot:536120_1
MTAWHLLNGIDEIPPSDGLNCFNPINECEIVACQQNKLLKYIIADDEWIEWMEIPKEFHIPLNVHYPNCMISQNIMYVSVGWDPAQIFKLNLNNKKIKILAEISNSQLNLFIANNQLNSIQATSHIIEYISDKLITLYHHVVWDEKKKSFEPVTALELFADHNNIDVIQFPSMEFVFILIKAEENFVRSRFIYCYEFVTNKLIKLQTTIPLFPDFQNGYVVTRDSRYCITFGGYDDETIAASDDIYIWDFADGYNNIIVKKSRVKCPVESVFHCVIIDGYLQEELLTFGYVKNCFKMNSFKNMRLPPAYLIKCIQNFLVYFEQIHLFECWGEEHLYQWKIDLNKLLV